MARVKTTLSSVGVDTSGDLSILKELRQICT